MVDLFQRLPGARRSPAGLERTVLRHLPRALWLGTLVLALPSLLVRLLDGWGGTGNEALTRSIDFCVAALVFLHWNLLLTVAIGAVIVMVMKGPAYVADPYPPLDRADPPAGPTP
ncbi:MAG: hypothetical protein J0M20_10880 [Burkholderiales bacterium]|nr:hypothetical protein [Burkholderiales bacterium]